MRKRLWLWLFTLAFAGFTLHATVCACEVVHPHHGSTKPRIVQSHSLKESDSTSARSLRHLNALHLALLALAQPSPARLAVLDTLPRFTLENTAPLLARGPPLVATTITLPDPL